jgi:large subunit ribosomal protein L15
MKIFDHKKREEFAKWEIPDDYNLNVNTLFPIPGSRKKFLRVGRGNAAGQGKSCGRGMRGQSSRSGEGKGSRAGFEGGQIPLYRRLPKFVGKPRNHASGGKLKKTEYTLIKLDMLNEVAEGSTVDFSVLEQAGVATKANKGITIQKVVGNGELNTKNLIVKAHKFTESAKQAIEANGGTCVIMSPTRPVPLEEALADRAKVDEANLVKLKALREMKAKTASEKADALL